MNPNKVFARVILASLLICGAASAQSFKFTLTTAKTFRQTSSAVPYREGYFEMVLHDGSYAMGGCGRISLNWFPRTMLCPQYPATGFVSNAPLAPQWGSPNANYYYEVASVTDPVAIEPFAASNVILHAAPQSTLPRPASGFVDASYDMFYDISGSNSVKDHRITLYGIRRDYTQFNSTTGAGVSSQESLMDAQIKPGIYQYYFPTLGAPTHPSTLAARYFTIAEGYRSVGSVKQGVKFTYPNVFGKDGFAFLNLKDFKPVTWTGMNLNNVYPSVDKLYLSIQALTSDPTSQYSVNSPTGARTQADVYQYPYSYFPSYLAPSSDLLLLTNPLVNSYTIPPITWLIEIAPQTLTHPEIFCIKELNAGTKGMLELDLVRNAPVNGVIYDTSTRKYQIPVVLGNSYEAYQLKTFGTAKAYSTSGAIDQDFDGDGYGNMLEWVLNTNAASKTSTPLITPKLVPYNPTTNTPAYFGFLLDKGHEFVPAVEYLEVLRSTDKGKTWAPMVSTLPTPPSTVATTGWTVINTPDLVSVEASPYTSATLSPIPPNPTHDLIITSAISSLGQIGIQSNTTDANGNPTNPDPAGTIYTLLVRQLGTNTLSTPVPNDPNTQPAWTQPDVGQAQWPPQ